MRRIHTVYVISLLYGTTHCILAGAGAPSPVRQAWYQLYRLLEIV